MLAAVPLIALCGCAATTSTHFTPSPQQPVCHVSSTAVVVWSPQWRADQKDVQAREVAASEGIARNIAAVADETVNTVTSVDQARSAVADMAQVAVQLEGLFALD